MGYPYQQHHILLCKASFCVHNTQNISYPTTAVNYLHRSCPTSIDYASPVWIALPQHLIDDLVKLSKRFHRVIHDPTCACTRTTDIKCRMLTLAKRLFQNVEAHVEHPIHRLIPTKNPRNRQYNIQYLLYRVAY